MRPSRAPAADEGVAYSLASPMSVSMEDRWEQRSVSRSEARSVSRIEDFEDEPQRSTTSDQGETLPIGD